MGFKLHDLAMMRAIARMEKTDHKIHHETNYVQLYLKILVGCLLLFIVGYIVLYQTVYLGNPIWGAWAAGVWILIELGNFVWYRGKRHKKRKG